MRIWAIAIALEISLQCCFVEFFKNKNVHIYYHLTCAEICKAIEVLFVFFCIFKLTKRLSNGLLCVEN